MGITKATNHSWKIKNIYIPKSDWSFNKGLKKASVKFKGNLTLQTDPEETKFISASLESIVEFQDIETKSLVGHINITTYLSFECDFCIEDFTNDTNSRRKFIKEISDVLEGYNRAKLIDIAKLAGLNAPVIIPLQELDFSTEVIEKVSEDNKTSSKNRKKKQDTSEIG